MKNIEEYYFITIETKKCNNGNINEILDYCIKIGLQLQYPRQSYETDEYLVMCFRNYHKAIANCDAGIVYGTNDLLEELDYMLSPEEFLSGEYDYLFDAGKLNLI